MPAFVCPGLPAAWVNAWLAGVGATVLNRRIRLHWTADDSPVAVLSSDDCDPVTALAESWPDAAFLRALPVADGWQGTGELQRKVTVEQFVARVREARGHPFAWTLSSTMTDLSVEENGEVAHAPFDPAGPGTVKWLHHRLLKVHECAGRMCADRLRASLVGRADRVKNSGLGFDCTRLGSLADKSEQWVEPVIELLAFFGLAMLPVRGRGVDHRFVRRGGPEQWQRGWRRSPGREQPRRFFWPVWHPPLNDAGIDALLDAWRPQHKHSWESLGIHAAWHSVEYRGRGPADTTRGIGSERV